jgi:hypothetical protein
LTDIFEFNSFSGDFPRFTVEPESAGKVSEDTAGTPDHDTVSLSLAGLVSEPFSLSTLTAATVSLLLSRFNLIVTKQLTNAFMLFCAKFLFVKLFMIYWFDLLVV